MDFFNHYPFNVWFVILIIGISGNTQKVSQHISDPHHENLTSLVFNVCQHTILQSQQELMYVVNLNSNPSAQSLIKFLHSTSIQTIFIDRLENLIDLSENIHRKNMIFLLKDMGESLSLILSSVAGKNKVGYFDPVNFTQNTFYNSSCDAPIMKRKNYKVANGLPRYCVEIDGASFESNARKTCDYKVNIASDELEDLSILSDTVFSLTKGLYRNDIWNSNNYIIFMLHQEAFHTVPYTMLRSKRQWNFEVFGNKTRVIPKPEIKMKKFVFKFFWRFFRGLKTIICERTFCERYNPFTEEVVTYYGKENEAYFDFSLNNMHKKPVGYIFQYESTMIRSLVLQMSPFWMMFLHESFGLLERSLNCTFEHLSYLLHKPEYTTLESHSHEIDIGLKYGAHLQSRNFISIYESMSISDTDYSVSVDSGVVCLITPHSQLVPQYLVIFKAFTPVVWIFIVITITIFIFMQHLFQLSQRETFQHFYSDAELSSYEGTSSMLTVFSYFICGSPPRLLLGRFYTGKVLFTVFSFATIIISTVFLDGMTTLLTKQVRYPEIDSLKDMEDANIFIQVLDAEKASRFFLQENKHKALATKLTNSSNSLHIFFVTEMERDWRLFIPFYNPDNRTDFGMDSTRRAEYEDYFMKNVMNLRAIYGSDAYLESIPQAIISKQSISIERFLQGRPMSYHLVEETLMTYPLSFTFVKNSFLFEKLNDKLAQMLEAGLAQQTVKSFVNDQVNRTEPGEPCDDCEPRPYDLRDLRLAFIALLSGLSLSFFAFLFELYIQFFGTLNMFKYLKRMRMLVSVRKE